jgi:hypothetical protein
MDDGTRQLVRIQHGPATVTGERIPNEIRPLLLSGREGRVECKDPGVRTLTHRPQLTDSGRGLREGGMYVEERSFPQGSISLGDVPWWSWLVLGLLLLVLFLDLSASGGLLAPLIGQGAGVTDYLHEFTHDARHLLSIPCH